MTVDRRLLEPEAAKVKFMDDSERTTYSCAISLKRIADALESGEIFRQPVNNYGESFTDAIQMAFVRGQRGVDVI